MSKSDSRQGLMSRRSRPHARTVWVLALGLVASACGRPASVNDVASAEPESAAATDAGYTRPEMLVDTVWLAGHLDDPTIRIVDTRRAGYDESHIPGAVYLDIATSRDAENPPTFLPSAEAFTEELEAIGIGNDTRVIFYDDRGGVYGTRPWLVLRTLGHTEVAILDGGWDAWTREDLPTTAEPTEVTRTEFEPKPDMAWIVTAEEVRDAIDRPGTRFVDTRTVDELAGRDLRGATRGGIIPSATAIYWEETFDPELKTFRSASELRALFAALDPGDEIIAYCEGGGRSAHELFAMHLVGYDRVRLYLGSWDEWGNRDDLPVATWEGTVAANRNP